MALILDINVLKKCTNVLNSKNTIQNKHIELYLKV